MKKVPKKRGKKPAAKTFFDKPPKEIKELIFRFLGSDEWVDKWEVVLSSKRITALPVKEGQRVYAETGLEDKIVVIDPHVNTIYEAVKTAIHEILHVLAGEQLHQALGEKIAEDRIMKLEDEVFAVFAPTEISDFLSAVFRKVKWDE